MLEINYINFHHTNCHNLEINPSKIKQERQLAEKVWKRIRNRE